ncbi:MAG: hypothetical protein Kow0099_06260 [Candidatus Abyssubacteria bacterium]
MLTPITVLCRPEARQRFTLIARRFVAFLLISLCISATIVGCGPQQKPLSLKLWEYPRWRETPDAIDRFFWMRRQAAEFERNHPGVSIELTELSWEHGEDKKRIAIAAGVGPDIMTGTLPVQFVQDNLLEPVTGYMTSEERADFLSPALDGVTYNGDLYGWPWYLTGNAMFLNLDLFKRFGVVPPDHDWTTTQFVDCAQKLTQDVDGDGIPDVHGFGFLVRPGDTAVWPFLFANGIRFNTHSGWDGLQEASAGLAFLRSLIHEAGVAPVQCAAWDTEALWQRFANRREIAMAPWGIWAIPKLRSLGDFSFTVLPFPSLDSPPAPPRRSFIGVSGIFVLKQKDERKRSLCMEFARFLVRPEAQKDLAQYGVFPSRASAGNIYEDDRLMAETQAIINNGQIVPKHPEWSKVDESLQRGFQLALLKEKSVGAVLNDAIAQARRAVQAKARTSGEDGTGRTNRVLMVVLILFVATAVATPLLLFFSRLRTSDSASALGFLLPALTIFAVFLLFPLVWVAGLSFQQYSIADGTATWTGFRNIRAVLHDAAFCRAAVNTVIYTTVVVPTSTLSALVVASLIYPLSERVRSFFRGAYYLPGVASVVVIAMVWRWMFNEDFGLLNQSLGFFGLPEIRWLTSPRVALWSVILMSIARPPGGPILIYLAALDAIPKSLYDAADMDGAGPLRKWWHISVPLLRPTTLFIALTISIASFQVFTQVFILTDGGPGYATEVIAHRIYTAAIRDFDFGMAAAMSLLLLVVIALASALQYRFFRSEVEY